MNTTIQKADLDTAMSAAKKWAQEFRWAERAEAIVKVLLAATGYLEECERRVQEAMKKVELAQRSENEADQRRDVALADCKRIEAEVKTAYEKAARITVETHHNGEQLVAEAKIKADAIVANAEGRKNEVLVEYENAKDRLDALRAEAQKVEAVIAEARARLSK